MEPGTVCRKATGNPRLFERLERRLAQTQADMERLEAFMKSHPVNQKSPSSNAPEREAS
jgi:ferritin-like metal-binding protein YciE